MHTIQSLATRYGISRQSVYARLQASGVTPTKQANRSLFTDEDVDQLDAQDQRLKAGYLLRDSVSSDVIDVSVAQQADTQLTVAESNAVGALLKCSRQPSSTRQVARHPTVTC